jgi:hypothetical protein
LFTALRRTFADDCGTVLLDELESESSDREILSFAFHSPEA